MTYITLFLCVCVEGGGGGGGYNQLLELYQAILNTVPSILLKLTTGDGVKVEQRGQIEKFLCESNCTLF